jgi:hypothetical protein
MAAGDKSVGFIPNSKKYPATGLRDATWYGVTAWSAEAIAQMERHQPERLRARHRLSGRESVHPQEWRARRLDRHHHRLGRSAPGNAPGSRRPAPAAAAVDKEVEF